MYADKLIPKSSDNVDSLILGEDVTASGRLSTVAMPVPLRVDCFTSVEALQRLAPEWRVLFAESRIALPFSTYEWVDSWWRHLRQDRLAVRDHLQIRAFRTEAGKLVAVAPLIRTHRPAIGPLGVRFLQFVGADPNMTEIRGMLTHPEFEYDAYYALIQDLKSVSYHWIRWNGIQSVGEKVLIPHLDIYKNAMTDLYLDLPSTWDEFHRNLKRNIRESLRKCYNSLSRDQLSFEMQVARTGDEVAAAVERFFELHQARAHANASVVHADVFGAPAPRAFLREVTGRFAARDEMRVFELQVEGVVVATRLGFQFGDTLYLYYSGYRPEWGRYSVMTTTVAEAIRYAIREGCKTVNLSTGLDISKTRWGPQAVRFGEGVQIAPSTYARFAYRLYERGFHLRRYPWVLRLFGPLIR